MTAGRASIKFHSFSYDNAATLTSVSAVTLQTPKLFVTCRVLVGSCVWKSLNYAETLVAIAFFRQVQLPRSINVDTVLVVTHEIAAEAVKLCFCLLRFLRFMNTVCAKLIRRNWKICAKSMKNLCYFRVISPIWMKSIRNATITEPRSTTVAESTRTFFKRNIFGTESCLLLIFLSLLTKIGKNFRSSFGVENRKNLPLPYHSLTNTTLNCERVF